MRQLLGFVLVASALAMPVAAQSRQAPVDLTGKWNLTVKSETGETGNAEVTLVQKGDSLIGRYTHEQMGPLEVVGTVKGKDFSFAYTTQMNGQALTFTVKGVVDGPDDLSGTASMAFMGNATFKATRSRQQRG
jgi:hypothetical protein